MFVGDAFEGDSQGYGPMVGPLKGYSRWVSVWVGEGGEGGGVRWGELVGGAYGIMGVA